MNRLQISKRAQIIGLLVEGNSMRSASRLADVSINTVTKLLVEVGDAASIYMDRVMRDLPCKRIQCDEIWGFCYSKQKNVPASLKGTFGIGDVWTWVALCPDTKLVPTFLVGARDGATAKVFIDDLAGRLKHRVHLTTDNHRPYLQAVDDAFGANIDYAVISKLYADPQGSSADKRYSPGQCCGTIIGAVCGNPDLKKASTSYVERQNLTIRMGVRRLTRLTNGFSKKVENHSHAMALHFLHYNFARIHKSLRVTPAMEAGVSSHVWTLAEIAELPEKIS